MARPRRPRIPVSVLIRRGAGRKAPALRVPRAQNPVRLILLAAAPARPRRVRGIRRGPKP
jgi:hypothetical protein